MDRSYKLFHILITRRIRSRRLFFPPLSSPALLVLFLSENARSREQIRQSDPVIQFLRATPSQRFVTRNHRRRRRRVGGGDIGSGGGKGKKENRKESVHLIRYLGRAACVSLLKLELLNTQSWRCVSAGSLRARARRAAACLRPQLTPAVRSGDREIFFFFFLLKKTHEQVSVSLISLRTRAPGGGAGPDGDIKVTGSHVRV